MESRCDIFYTIDVWPQAVQFRCRRYIASTKTCTLWRCQIIWGPCQRPVDSRIENETKTIAPVFLVPRRRHQCTQKRLQFCLPIQDVVIHVVDEILKCVGEVGFWIAIVGCRATTKRCRLTQKPSIEMDASHTSFDLVYTVLYHTLWAGEMSSETSRSPR